MGTGIPSEIRDPMTSGFHRVHVTLQTSGLSPDSYGRLFYQSSESTSISPETHCGHSLYSDPLNKAASTDSSLKASEDDHIYATLSETFGSLSSISDEYLGDNPRCPSATTVANDDFEYHGPQDGSCDTSLQPCELGNESVEYVSAYNTAMSPNTALVNDIPLKDRLSFLTSEDIYEEESPSSSFRSCSSVPSEVNTSLSSEFMKSIASYCPSNIVRPSSPRLGYVNRAFVRDIEETLHRPLPSVPEEGTLTRKHRSSSLSMNDLDQIEPEEEDEMMFILPVKSESMLSLYRLYLAEDEPTGTTNLHYSLEISKSESDLTSPYRKISFQNLSPVQEIYRKKRVPKSAASRIRRQHKIQRAKGLQNKTRPIIKIRDPEIYQYSKSDKSPANTEENCTKSRDNGSGSSSSEEPPTKLEVQLAVMNKNKRKNGIITITDPSVLSVEELVKVLNRASGSSDPHDKDRGKGSDPNAFCSVSYPVTEYKKIFVSEYI
ncbi:hypothetical protein Avbf_16373 [Armadillidium vulgare]|nr:hypothetical protein Avbf_16373 [Armadillidium vulgare]